MHVRIAVVRLMGILNGVVRIHVIRHGASVDHEIRGVIGLSRDLETASWKASSAAHSYLDLRLSLGMDVRIHFGELEQVFPVVTSLGVVVGSSRKAEIIFTPVRLGTGVVSLRGSTATKNCVVV